MEIAVKPRAAAVLSIALVFFSALWLGLSARFPGIFVEHGPMENFQAICIALGCLLFLWRLPSTHSAQRVFIAALALFYATFLVVEFDTRELGWRVAAAVLNGPVRNISLVVIWLLLAVWALRHHSALVPTASQWLPSPAFFLLLTSGVFWIAGGIVDKLKLLGPTTRNLLAEELLETNAALLMLLAALAVARQIAKRSTSGVPLPAACPDLPGAHDSRR